MAATLSIRSSSINQYSPFAEKELTLSDIDSMWQNGEISQDEASNMATEWLLENNADIEIFAAILKKRI